MTIKRYYGWRPDLPDHRDRYFAPAPHLLAAVPDHIDLRHAMPGVFDQGAIGSCTANAIAAAMAFQHRVQALPDFMASRLFIYYEERRLEGSEAYDAGAFIRDGFKVISKVGACDEYLWPYDPGRFAERPPAAAYRDARQDLIVSYARVNQSANDFMATLAEGHAIVFGFTVYENIEEAAATGILIMPGKDQQVRGGHAVVMAGYDRPAGRVLVRNSWGSGFGQGGYFWMPFAYVTSGDLAADFWTVKVVR